MARIAKIKNGFPPKVCQGCGLAFEWRKKWERDWESVKFCSERCKNVRLQDRKKAPKN